LAIGNNQRFIVAMKMYISLPSLLLKAVNRLARRLRMARNRFFITAVSRYIHAVDANNVMERLNRVYSDESSDILKLPCDIAHAQSAILKHEKWQYRHEISYQRISDAS
jgi:metal-responsive CopG/Arc/MetJ family transcriptional regulator